MQHGYSFLQRRALQPLVALALLATAGAAHAQIPTPTFAPVAIYGTSGSFPNGIAVADVNGDSKPDLLTTNYGSGTVGVLLGNGNGTFQFVATYYAGNGPSKLAVADVNGDGKPDILTTNSTSLAGVLLGNGNGTFQPAIAYGAGSASSGIAVADVNGDGKPDLLTTDNSNSRAGVLLGNGNGTFGVATTYGTPSGPLDLAVADVNGDGKLDLLTTSNGNGTSRAGVLLGNGNGTFQPATAYSTGGTNTFSIAVADVNGDGQPDLFTANEGSATAGVLLGNGNGTFQPATTYGVGSSNPTDITVADVNGDGKPDLLTANNGNNTIGLLLGNGNGTFQTATTYSAGSIPFSVAAADVNGDGQLDLIAANNISRGTIGVLLNTTGLAQPTLTALSPATGPVGTAVTITGANLTGATAVRFNGTPASSFVVNSATSITAVVAFGTTTGSVQVTTPIGIATSGTSFVVRVAPTTVADSYTTPADVTLTGNVLTNDLGTNPRAILILYPTHGTLVLNPTGTFTYRADAGYSGPDSFIYYACDQGTPLLCGNPVTVSITVTPGRVAPVTVADSYTTPQGMVLTGNVLANDLGTNPRAILIIRPTRGVLVLNPDGSFSYQPNVGFVGSDSFIYYACDQGTPLLCGNPVTVSLTVLPAGSSARGATAAAGAPAIKPAGGATVALELTLAGHPNPFGDELQFSFSLPIAQAYTLALYDAQGRLVRQLASSQAEAGQAQQLAVPTHTYTAGLYLVRLTTATGTRQLKLIKQ